MASNKILSTPIKAYRFSPNEREQGVEEEYTRRLLAVAKEQGIEVKPDAPEFWPRLGFALLLDHYPEAFSILERPRGGAKKNPDAEYIKLADRFDAHVKAGRPGLSATTHAKNFLWANRGAVAVGKEKITTQKALAKAVNRGRTARDSARKAETYLRAAGLHALGIAGAPIYRGPIYLVQKK